MSVRFPRPELLTHPNVPKPLHGTNPRTALGQKWWNEHRFEAYAQHEYKCWACGVHKKDALYHQWLEGHESYDIDYATGTVTLNEIVALCNGCHTFIHSGRLESMWRKGKYRKETVQDILWRGFGILYDNGFEPFFGTVDLARAVGIWIPPEWAGIREKEATVADWNDWKLIIDGKEFRGQFESYKAWEDFYA